VGPFSGRFLINELGILSVPRLLLLLFCRTERSSFRFRGRLKQCSLEDGMSFGNDE